MSKLTALGMSITLDDGAGAPQIITPDVGSFTLNTPRGVIDVSGLDVLGYVRLLGRSDVTGTLNGFYDSGAGTALAHTVLKTVPTQAGTLTRTLTVGFSTGTATAEVVVTDYPLTVGNDGAITWAAPFQAANGSAITWS